MLCPILHDLYDLIASLSGPPLLEKVFGIPAPLAAGTELGVDVIVSHLDDGGSGRVAIELSADDFDVRYFHIDLRLWGQRQYVL